MKTDLTSLCYKLSEKHIKFLFVKQYTETLYVTMGIQIIFILKIIDVVQYTLLALIDLKRYEFLFRVPLLFYSVQYVARVSVRSCVVNL